MESESVEYKTLIKCTDRLTIAFRGSIVSTANELLANGFMSPEAHGNILTTPGWGENEKASRLMMCVADTVKMQPAKYREFLALPMLSQLHGIITTEYSALAESTKLPCGAVSQATQEVSIDPGIMADRNLQMINGEFSSLSRKVQLVLQSRDDITVDEIHSFLIRYFARSDWTQKPSTIDELFNALSVANLWSYSNYGPMEDIVKHFLPNDGDMKKRIAGYKTKLNGFYTATKIADFIKLPDLGDSEYRYQDPEQPLPEGIFTLKDYCKLKLKLNLGNRKVSAMTLSYVDELWRSLAEEFDLPCLTAVIQSIIKGSLQITWYILPHFAKKIIDKTTAAKDTSFFQKHRIALLQIDNHVIYDEKKDIKAMRRDITLFDACWGGHSAFAKMLLTSGANPNFQNKEGISCLYISSKKGHDEVVMELLEYEAEVNLPVDCECGNTALTIACENEYVKITKLLLEYGAFIDHKNKKGMSPLNIASERDYVEVAKVLLEYRPDINLPNNEGNSPLYISSIRGHVELVKLLLNHGADVNLPKNDDSGYTSLIGACWSGYVEIAEELLNHGADINYRCKNGASALYIASQNNRIEVVETLLKFEAQVNLPNDDNKGYTALIIACQNGYADLAMVLLNNGAAVDSKTKMGNTSLSLASFNNHLEVMEVLLEFEATVDLQTDMGNTSLSLASFNNHLEVMEVLLEFEATVDLQTDNQWGDNSLIAACSHGHVDAAELLLNNGALVNYSNKLGVTALHASCLYGYSRIVELLINRGALINVQAIDGSTPLHFAYTKNHIGAANVLQDAGALSDIPNNDGITSKMLSNEQELGSSDINILL